VCRSNTYFSVSVNGVNYGTSDSVFTPLGCPAEIGIGAVRYVTTGRYAATSGNYDDVRLYNRALTGDEIKKLYVFTQKQRESYASVSRDIPYENLPTNGLIAHWKLDELSYNGTAGEVKDSSGNGNDCTSVNGAGTNPGKLGRSLYCLGKCGAVCPATAALNPADAVSVSLWAKVNDGPAWSQFITMSTAYAWYMRRTNTGKIQAVLKTADDSILQSVSAYTITPDSGWVHAVFTYDSVNDDLVRLYVNGQLDGTSANSGHKLIKNTILLTLCIGGWADTSDNLNPLNGSIDDVRIYDRALSPEEIAQIYKAKPRKESVVAIYSGNKLISNPEKKDYPNTVSENIEPVTLTFEYVSTYPATITIGGTGYGQPADPYKALVDAGDGVFVPWTSNTITLKGKRIRFRGDWRNSGGNFRDLFSSTFTG
jgi:hypothetical protein